MAEKESSGLFKTEEKAYGAKYVDHLLEQYKLYVEMADRISSRRALSNTFFLTVNTALLSGLGLFGKNFLRNSPFDLVTVIVVTVGSVVFSVAWWLVLSSFDKLNGAKFTIIHELERKLPAALYTDEWDRLGRGQDPKRYRPISRVEMLIPKMFIIAYVIFGVLWILAALQIF